MMFLLLSKKQQVASNKATRWIRSPLYDIGIILCIKLMAVIALWWYFFSAPVSHDMTVDAQLMEQHFLDTESSKTTSHHHSQSSLHSKSHTHERTR